MLIQSAQLALILLIGALVMRDRTRARPIAGMAVSVAGVLLIIARGDPYALVTLRRNIGDAMIGAAGALWAPYSVLARRHPIVLRLSSLDASNRVGVVVLLPV